MLRAEAGQETGAGTITQVRMAGPAGPMVNLRIGLIHRRPPSAVPAKKTIAE
jgi:hypothetical protein